MEMQPYNEESKEKLPVEPRTFALGLLRRSPWLLAFVLVSGALGIFVGLNFGSRVYEAHTQMIYKPSFGGIDGDVLKTKVNMAKLSENLAEVRKRLGLETKIEPLGRAIDFWFDRNSNLVRLSVSWSNREDAMAIAKTMRDVFFDSQMDIRRQDAQKRIQDIEARLKPVKEELADSKAKLLEFSGTHADLDLDADSNSRVQEYNSIQKQYDEAKTELSAIDEQFDSIAEQIAELELVVARERTESNSGSQKAAERAKRIKELQEKIQTDKKRSADMVTLAKLEVDFNRSKALLEEGLISQAEFEKTKADYERQRIMTEDSAQAQKWEAELESIQAELAEEGGGDSASERLLQDRQLRSFELKMERVAVAEKFDYLERSRREMREKLSDLPKLQLEFLALNEAVSERDAERRELEAALVNARRDYDTTESEFQIVNEVTAPAEPTKSNRKILCIIVTILGTGLGVFIVLLLEVLDFTLKSSAEAELKTGLNVLGVIPEIKEDSHLLPNIYDPGLMDRFRLISRRIRQVVPTAGARLMVVSALEGEGKTLVAKNLALYMGKQKEKVLLIGTRSRKDSSGERVLDLIPSFEGQEDAAKGKSKKQDGEESVKPQPNLPAKTPGTRVGASLSPDLLASDQMGQMFDSLSEEFSVLVVDCPSIFPLADTSLLAQWADGFILVVQSGRTKASTVRKSIERLQEAGKPIVGIILNRVKPIYLEGDEK